MGMCGRCETALLMQMLREGCSDQNINLSFTMPRGCIGKPYINPADGEMQPKN